MMKNRGMVFVLILLTLVLATGMPAAEGDPSGEFQEILGKLQRQSRTATPYAFVDQAEKLLFGFLEKYPESPEAAKAHFTLGRVYSSIGKHKDAVEHINNYLTAKIERIPSHEALARYFLAASHLALENFDTSEKLLRELVSNDRLDRRLSEMAQRELARIGTLRKLGIGAPAIGFSAMSSGGKRITLDDFKGKVVLLDFWASWCAPCRKEMPSVKKLYNDLHDKGFEIIGISLDDKRENFEGYVSSQKLSWPQIYDGKGWMSEIGRNYAVNSIPATFLIDRQGKIRYKRIRGSELEKAVRELVAGK